VAPVAEKKFNTRLRVAVVDDDPEMVKSIKLMLSIAGADVLEAITGISGYLLVRRTLPDAVLLDIMMPDLDGFEVCRKLKLDSQTKDIPIIFVTARSGQEHIDRGLSLGAQGFISKPFTPEDLVDKINQVTGK
jgi:DNA-binding response OmpR family regulator